MTEIKYVSEVAVFRRSAIKVLETIAASLKSDLQDRLITLTHRMDTFQESYGVSLADLNAIGPFLEHLGTPACSIDSNRINDLIQVIIDDLNDSVLLPLNPQSRKVGNRLSSIIVLLFNGDRAARHLFSCLVSHVHMPRPTLESYAAVRFTESDESVSGCVIVVFGWVRVSLHSQLVSETIVIPPRKWEGTSRVMGQWFFERPPPTTVVIDNRWYAEGVN
jgi:hypothetical protein